jgi:hypothetical protein
VILDDENKPGKETARLGCGLYMGKEVFEYEKIVGIMDK